MVGTFHSAADAVIDAWSGLLPLLAEHRPRLFVHERDLDRDQAAVRRLPPGERLRERLRDTPGLFEQLRRAGQAHRLDAAQLDRLQPWFVAAWLQQAAAATGDAAILDQQLAETAAALSLKRLALERLADIAAYYRTRFSRAERRRLLAEAACNQPLLATAITQQSRAFAADDVAAFWRALHRFDGADRDLAARLNEVFVADRNEQFWRRLAPEFRRGGVFLALGALHLIGERGLYQRLRQSGAVLTPLRPAELRFRRSLADHPRLLAWLRAQPELAARDTPLAALGIVARSLPALRRELCPGRRCTVESSYREGEVWFESGLFARLITPNAAGRDYLLSLLAREAARHRLLAAHGAAWRRELAGRGAAMNSAGPAGSQSCLARLVLHRAALLQQRYLREHGSRAQARPFALDPRCPRLP